MPSPERPPLNRVVVVGASLAGLSACETLRGEGFEGELVAIGAEPILPYDRPPLSKQILQGAWTPEQANLRDTDSYDKLGLDWKLGRRAAALDVAGHMVTLDDGEPVPYDGLVIATGARPRRLPATPDLAGIHVLRTMEDCLAIRKDFEGASRVCVVGAGFIGAEVAASARKSGLDVIILEAFPAPLSRVLPTAMGDACAAIHLDQGVELRCGVGVEGFDGHGRVERVRLSDGSWVEADVVVVGVGVIPETGWLETSGLALGNGVICDETCTAAPGIVAAGDIAWWPNRLFDEEMRIEQWSNAVEQGAAAAKTLVAGPGAAEPFAPVPYFWSDQYDTKIQFVGRCGPDDEIFMAEGSVEERKFVALFGRHGRLWGALAFNRPRPLMGYRRMIAASATWEQALEHARST